MPPGWCADPWARHERRWWNGQAWTADVLNHGVQSIDPGDTAPPPAPTPVPVAPSLPPQQPVAPRAVLPSMKLGKAPRSAKPKRQTGRKIVKGLLVLTGLFFIAVVGIAVLAPPPDDTAEVANAAGDTTDRVPVLLGDDATHSERSVSAAEFGDEWPFTVASGTVVCEALPSSLEVYNVFFVDGAGVIYPINGIALGRSDAYDWSEIEAIWTPDPDIVGTRISIGPMIRAGLDICVPAEPSDSATSDNTDAEMSADLIEASAEIVWELKTPDERREFCTVWQGAPEALEQAMILEADGDSTAWRALEAILIEQC